jgi:hypothetical protein
MVNESQWRATLPVWPRRLTVDDDIGVIFENERRQRESLYKLNQSDQDKQRLLCEH